MRAFGCDGDDCEYDEGRWAHREGCVISSDGDDVLGEDVGDFLDWAAYHLA